MEGKGLHQYDLDNAEIGIVDTKCHAGRLISKCTQLAHEAMIQVYGNVPNIVIQGHPNIRFLYIPDQIEYILFELLKNSIKFTTQHHATQKNSSQSHRDLPEICVHVSSNPSPDSKVHPQPHTFQTVTFRVSDQGGGFKGNDRQTNGWLLAADEIIRNSRAVSDTHGTSEALRLQLEGKISDHGFDPALPPQNHRVGIGLLMSRVFAEYWGGSIDIMSLNGYGSDVYVRIQVSGDEGEKLVDYM